MTTKVIKAITKYNMLSKGDTVGVGLSGGADSVALLHILVKNRSELGISHIKAIHIHHGIRGTEADRDLEFSKAFCEKLGVELVSFFVNVPDEAQKTGESIEECARRLRYECFLKSGCAKIATAHNLNDNIETVIFNMARGTSISGLCGIPYVRECYIRPLLDCTRQEIEEYISENSLEYVTDSTNLCDDYTRNKIRHNIIPQFFELNPNFSQGFANCNESVRLANDYISLEAVRVLENARSNDDYDCEKISSCHKVIKNQVISKILKEQGVPDITKKYIDAVLHIIENGGKASLGGNVTASSHKRILSFKEIEELEHFEIGISDLTGQIQTPVGVVSFDLLKENSQKLDKFKIQNSVDCDKICGRLTLRNRLEGDAYCPLKRVNKKLKKLFTENNISVANRSRMLIMTDEKGIIWTEFFGVADRCKIENNTKSSVMITVMGE